MNFKIGDILLSGGGYLVEVIEIKRDEMRVKYPDGGGGWHKVHNNWFTFQSGGFTPLKKHRMGVT